MRTGSAWRLVLAAVVLAGLAVVAIVVFTPLAGVPQPTGGSGEAAGSAHDHSSSALDGATSSDEPDAGVALDPSAAVPSTVGTTPETTLASAASAAVSQRDMTTQSGERGDVAPEAILGGRSDSLGGCLNAYGATGQCLTSVPPSMSAHLQAMVDAGLDPSTMPHAWTCTEVRVYFPAGITVRVPGVDPHGLDRTGDGLACGPDD